MPILNYTTSIDAEKTVAQIQKMLSMTGASAIMTEYDKDKVLSSISFRVSHQGQDLAFRLPAQIDKIWTLLQADSKVPRKLKSREQAAKVTWRIIKDWVEAQLAIIEAEQAEMIEVFLPYMQDAKTGETFYQSLESKGLGNLLGYTQESNK
jgi:hypothetical protein